MTTQEERAARIKAARSKSLKLMQMDGTLNKIAESKKDDINRSFDNDNITTGNLMSPSSIDRTNRMATGKMSVAASNVPSIIRESFQSQPPLAQQSVSSSVLDGMFGDLLTEQVTQPIMNEGVQQQQTQQTPQYPSQVDYPTIRTIVEEIVRKYTTSLSKKLVNENKGSEVNTISLGKSFKFLANNGDIYECTMRKVSNINEIKNKKSVNG
jgi:hypothetical protein